jgi:hypothetical protein
MVARFEDLCGADLIEGLVLKGGRKEETRKDRQRIDLKEVGVRLREDSSTAAVLC